MNEDRDWRQLYQELLTLYECREIEIRDLKKINEELESQLSSIKAKIEAIINALRRT